MSWNITDNSDGTYTLLNGTGTLIRKHKQIPLSLIVELLSKMEEIEFPIGYTEALEEIYFTYLKRGLEGDYAGWPGTIRISCNNTNLSHLHEILIHEIAHHIDARECVSTEKDLVGEWMVKSGSFIHSDIKRESCEYFAIGFEKFYTPDHSSGNITEDSHPVLWHSLSQIHSKKATK